MADLTVEQMQSDQKVQAITSNAIVLSNVVELVTSVVRAMAQQDVSGAMSNGTQTRDIVANTVTNHIKHKLGL